MKSPKLLLIDDHAMFRAGLSMVIAMALPDAVLLQAGSLSDALATAPQDINVVLLDIKLNGSSGLDGIERLRQYWPTAPVLMLSSLDTPEIQALALSRGSAAFVSKAETAEHIVAMVRRALSGDLGGELGQPGRSSGMNIERPLTPRQREVLELLHQGFSNKLIARQLQLSENTVRRHVQGILEYFQVMSRAEAVFAARQMALVG